MGWTVDDPPERVSIQGAAGGLACLAVGAGLVVFCVLAAGRPGLLPIMAGGAFFIAGGAWYFIRSLALPLTTPGTAQPPSRARVTLLLADYLLLEMMIGLLASGFGYATWSGSNGDFGSTQPARFGLSEGAIVRAVFGLAAVFLAALFVAMGIVRARRLRRVIEQRRTAAGLRSGA